jgi:hypothetical protein
MTSVVPTQAESIPADPGRREGNEVKKSHDKHVRKQCHEGQHRNHQDKHADYHEDQIPELVARDDGTNLAQIFLFCHRQLGQKENLFMVNLC